MVFKWLLIGHLIGAAIWIGGHLLLCVRYLPEAIRLKNPEIITQFEKKYEIIGLPALVVQVITGIWMAVAYYNVTLLSFATAMESAVSIKLILLFITVLLAMHVRFFVFPKLTAKNLWFLAWHIIAVTCIGLLLLYFGISIRFGGL